MKPLTHKTTNPAPAPIKLVAYLLLLSRRMRRGVHDPLVRRHAGVGRVRCVRSVRGSRTGRIHGPLVVADGGRLPAEGGSYQGLAPAPHVLGGVARRLGRGHVRRKRVAAAAGHTRVRVRRRRRRHHVAHGGRPLLLLGHLLLAAQVHVLLLFDAHLHLALFVLFANKSGAVRFLLLLLLFFLQFTSPLVTAPSNSQVNP